MVPLLDLDAQYRPIRDEVLAATSEWVTSVPGIGRLRCVSFEDEMGRGLRDPQSVDRLKNVGYYAAPMSTEAVAQFIGLARELADMTLQSAASVTRGRGVRRGF